MQGYSFAPPSGPPREGQKNYVFVDEHNRHKRLKGMRSVHHKPANTDRPDV
ncbi:hypothetical protein PDIG_82160 [Penicillium digitatum PHI26]|uniref:Uncharacterized protein n=2 Tax=Penicillium digitatum TaxID=36651 RepID=K9F950_PEND2|nr:hypothetical protein PDIP_85530 [Penicillium digitatum Pd1]EKV04960.1 hypothetical protein PDIP_85530 [Penicillium digitatum Pd1]EKV05674.1 hypothetical protein PDIG_82160 [Penicillium digitatum PHI26]